MKLNNIKISDLVIIFVILIIIGLFVVPANAALVDSFILFNLLITIVLLSLVVLVDTPTKLSFFPSLLLIMTLFRIALSVATARLILLTGTAGHFIETAGQFLIGDNLVVGIIIFAIIAIVNFLVVTKGSERVAEVVARFTLDGLPGKQMSIDADLKAGNITMDEAKHQRRTLQLESSLYGALDGATKFIKGDVISNMIIVMVNLVGGIIIAMYQKDYDLAQAVSTYSILSIGDGLLQQIPITLTSIAGGIIVTRINTTVTTGSIGDSIRDIIKESNVVLLIPACILPLLLMVKGLPRVPITVALVGFILLFLLTHYRFQIKEAAGTVASKISDYSAAAASPPSGNESEDNNHSTNLPPIDPWKVYPIIVVLAADLVKSKKNRVIKATLESVNTYLHSRLGIELPQIFITQGNLPESSYQILINEVVTSEATLYEDFVLVPSSQVNTIIDEEFIFPNKIEIGQMELGYWVSSEKIEVLESLNISYLSVDKFLLEHVTTCLINSLQDLIGFQEIKVLLDKMVDYQDLIKELLRMIPLNKITEIIKRLLIEKIPIRNFKVILDKLLEWAPKESETILLVEYVRIGLGKYIGQMYKIDGKIYAISIDSDLEDTIMESIRYTSNGFYLDLMDSFYDEFNDKLAAILEPLKLKNKIVIITRLTIRKAVSHIVGKKYNIAVLSQEEVQASEVELEVIDFIY